MDIPEPEEIQQKKKKRVRRMRKRPRNEFFDDEAECGDDGYEEDDEHDTEDENVDTSWINDINVEARDSRAEKTPSIDKSPPPKKECTCPCYCGASRKRKADMRHDLFHTIEVDMRTQSAASTVDLETEIPRRRKRVRISSSGDENQTETTLEKLQFEIDTLMPMLEQRKEWGMPLNNLYEKLQILFARKDSLKMAANREHCRTPSRATIVVSAGGSDGIGTFFLGRPVIDTEHFPIINRDTLELPDIIPDTIAQWKENLEWEVPGISRRELENLLPDTAMQLSDNVPREYFKLLTEESWLEDNLVILDVLIGQKIFEGGFDAFSTHREVSLVDKTLVIPVLTECNPHYFMVGWNPIERKMKYYDSIFPMANKLENFKTFLEKRDEYEAYGLSRNIVECDESLSDELMQTNEIDCGVYLMMFARCFLDDRSFVYRPEDIRLLRMIMFFELIMGRLVSFV